MILDSLANACLGSDDQGVGALFNILVLKFGQSNALTHAPTANLSTANAPLANSYPNVTLIAQQDSTFGDDPMVWQNDGPHALGSTTYDAHSGGGPGPFMGFELTMMRDLDISLPKKRFCVAIIAVGGASLKTNFNPSGTYPLNPAAGPNLFTQCVTFTKQAMVTLGCTSVIACWEQGEEDAKNTTDGTNYAAELEAFIDAFRSQMGNLGPGGSAIPFVVGRLNADAAPATYLGLSQLRASQATAVSARSPATLVSQDSINQASGLYDGTHYTADGYITLGHLWSPAVAAFAGTRVQPVASFTFVTSALQATFTDTSVSYGDTITAWDWNFGDGTAHGTTQNPVHTYAASGTYNVTLKVTNSVGDTNTSAPVAVSVISGFSGVTRDALSTWYTPATAAEWTTFLTDISSTMSAPDELQLLQEASGNAADSIGTITLTAAGAFAYQQAVSGWTRKAMIFTDNTTQGLSSTSASLPDISTTSQLTLLIFKAPAAAPGVNRGVIAHGTSAATRCAVFLATTGKLTTESTTTNTAASTSTYTDGSVHILVLQTNRTGTSVVGYTELDKMVPTFGATMTGKGLYLGTETGALSAPAIGVLYRAGWNGAKAEVTSAAIKTLVQGLTGLTVSWS